MKQNTFSPSQIPFLRRNWSIMLVSIIACIVFLLTGCGTQTTSQTQAAKTNTVVMNSSWAEYYKTLKDLKAHADLTVQGTFTGVLRTIVDQKELVYTDFTFSVTRTIYAHKKLSTSVITIRQEGGVYKNTLYRQSDDPNFQIGEQSFLFLRETSPGLYIVIGGPSGRFDVQNGNVKPVANDAVQLPASTNISSFTNTITRNEAGN